MTFARYNWTCGVFLVPPLVALILLVLFMKPATGDLTLLGGYLEADFKWSAPQLGYSQSGFKLAKTIDDYDRYYDVVVLGDSFSADKEKGWQNRLHERTGSSVITFEMPKLNGDAVTSSAGVNVKDIISSTTFRLNPPRYFIFESIERDSLIRLGLYADSVFELGADRFKSRTDPHRLQNDSSPAQLHEIIDEPRIRFEIKVLQAGNYLVKAVSRHLVNVDNVRVLELNNGALFTNKSSNQLLIYGKDLKKNQSKEDFTNAMTGLKRLQNAFEEQANIRFIPLIFPDKLTVYTPYLKPSADSVPSYIPLMAEHTSIIRLDSLFQSALSNGVQDLYLPNDTHLGYIGHRLTADTIIDAYFGEATALDK